MSAGWFKAGDVVLSQFHVVHRIASTDEAAGTVALQDGRRFDATNFRPYVREFHGGLDTLVVCNQCGPFENEQAVRPNVGPCLHHGSPRPVCHPTGCSLCDAGTAAPAVGRR